MPLFVYRVVVGTETEDQAKDLMGRLDGDGLAEFSYTLEIQPEGSDELRDLSEPEARRLHAPEGEHDWTLRFAVLKPGGVWPWPLVVARSRQVHVEQHEGYSSPVLHIWWIEPPV
jgi:hypothetical protein